MNKKIIIPIVIVILAIPMLFVVFQLNNKLSYTDFIQVSEGISKDLDSKYDVVSKSFIYLNPYWANVDDQWAKTEMDADGNDASKSFKRQILIKENDYYGQVTLNYTPQINDKAFLGINDMGNFMNPFMKETQDLPTIYTDIFTTKGITIHLECFKSKSLNDSNKVDEEVSDTELTEFRTKILSSVQSYLIQNQY